VWDSGWWPPPATFLTLERLWHPQNHGWTEQWLCMLRHQSAIATDEWHLLRKTELKEAAERARLGAICRFYTGKELHQLLCPTAPALHSPQLLVEAIKSITVTGRRADTAAFLASLGQRRVQVETGVDGTVYVSNIRPAEVDNVLCLVEGKGIVARLGLQRTLVHEVSDRLCAWESALAIEAKASKARCTTCYRHDLSPVTRTIGSAQSEREVRWWCCRCSRYRPYEVRAADYTDLPFCTAGIPQIPLGAGETLWGAITTQDVEFFVGQLPNNRAYEPSLPYELLRYAPYRMKEVVLTCINLVLTGEAQPPRSWLGGLIRFLLKKEDVLDTAGYRPICLLDTVYKCLSAIIRDRLYRLPEWHNLLDPSQEGLRSTQRQVQSLHWVIQEAAGATAVLLLFGILLTPSIP
jgi:hypothetical protein